MKHQGRSVTVALSALLASACTLGPDYARPPTPMPRQWRAVSSTEAGDLANLGWWEIYGDEVLTSLVRTALTENRDLAIAVERITEARAQLAYTRADLFPKTDLNGAYTSAQASRTGVPAIPKPTDNSSELYRSGLDLSWEIDLFGRIRRSTEAELAELMGAEDARRTVVMTLVGDVARAYFELRDLDQRLEVSRRTLDSRRAYVDLAEFRFHGGVTSELDYQQAEAELHRTAVLAKDFERLVLQKENELSLLLGHAPGAIPRGRTLAEQGLPLGIPAGLPSDLLDRRPDVHQAEQTLVAATARIGEAKALMFPRIALTGSLGYESSELGDLFSSPALAWSLVPSLAQPLFNAGKNLDRLDIQESRAAQALLGYQRTILGALRDVEDGLAAYRSLSDQRGEQAARVGAQRKVLELAELRYQGGVSAYLEVLDAQRSLFNAELEASQTIRDHLVSLVRLYKALGGGWSVAEPAIAVVPPAELQSSRRP